MAGVQIRDTVQVGVPVATSLAKLPDFWPMLGLASTLRPVAGVAGQLQVTPPDFAPIPVPAAIDIVAENGGSAVSLVVELPQEMLDNLPYVGAVPFGKGKKIAVSAITNTLKVIHIACMTNYVAYLNDLAGHPGAPVTVPGTPMTFASKGGESFNLHYDVVSAELPALWKDLPIASELVPDGATGRYKIVPGRYAPLPVTGYVQLTPNGSDSTSVSFQATLNLPLGELPWFVPKGAVASSLQGEFAKGLTIALRQCEQLLIARQKGLPPPTLGDDLAA